MKKLLVFALSLTLTLAIASGAMAATVLKLA